MTNQRLSAARYLTLVLLCAVALLGFGCRRTPGTGEQLGGNLVVWGLWQESAHLKPVLDAFEAQYGVKVDYKKVGSVATYEKELLEAFAQGKGPDVFVLHHTWIEGKRGLLAPAPTAIIDQRALQDEFVDVVSQDVMRDGLVYALPTSVDTLAMYYNKDILNAANIPGPPKTWTDVQQVAKRVTKVNRVGSIEQSAVALGTARNVNRAMDVLQLLILQSGLPIVTEGEVHIANETGTDALIFYTDFANKAKEVYTWDLGQDFSIDAFAEGDTAMMFNYSYHVPTVRAKNPGLNFAVAPMPQIAGSSTTNFANFAAYWPFGVSIHSSAPRTAWQFLRFMTSKEPASLVNHAQGVPPARRDSLGDFAADPILGVFADQVLTAKTWPRADIVASDAIFNTMVDSIVKGEAGSYEEALRRAEDQLNLLQKRDE